MLPHVRVGDSGPESNLLKTLANCSKLPRFHLCADSAFGTTQVMDAITAGGGKFTLSFGKDVLPEVWKALTLGLREGHWRAVTKNGVTYSASCAADHNRVLHYHKAVSTAVSSIIHVLGESSEEGNQDQGLSSGLPLLTKEELLLRKVPELKEMCKVHNIKVSGRKEALIEAIIKRGRTIHSKRSGIGAVRSKLEEDDHPGMGPVNALYKQTFNGVDLLDRYHGQVKEMHAVQHWETRMVLNLLRNATINSWTWAQTVEYHDWKEYRVRLAHSILSS